jgi:hypothetical protein
MHRTVSRLGVMVSLVALAGTAACAQNAFTPVSITTSDQLVSSCQKVGTVTAKATTASPDVNGELTLAARKQNANYVLVASDGAREGTAYRCTTPSTGAAAASSK